MWCYIPIWRQKLCLLRVGPVGVWQFWFILPTSPDVLVFEVFLHFAWQAAGGWSASPEAVGESFYSLHSLRVCFRIITIAIQKIARIGKRFPNRLTRFGKNTCQVWSNLLTFGWFMKEKKKGNVYEDGLSKLCPVPVTTAGLFSLFRFYSHASSL